MSNDDDIVKDGEPDIQSVDDEDLATVRKNELSEFTEISAQRGFSSISQQEKNLCFKKTEFERSSIVLDKLDKQNVKLAVDELQRDVKHLQTENKVLIRFIERNDPILLEGMDANLKQALMGTKQGTQPGKMPSRRASILSEARSESSESSDNRSLITNHLGGTSYEVPKINLNQRTDLVMREMEEIQATLDADIKKGQNIKFNLLCRIEEMESRKAELEESIENFEKFVEIQEIMTMEKFGRFMDEWSKKSRLLVDKIRLRYSSLKVQYQKLSAVLTQKQLIGENLQEIDFEQLRIENVHLREKIEKKNVLLLELKKMTGAGNLMLTQQKQILQQKMIEKEELMTAIRKKEKEIIKSDDEIYRLYIELDEAKNEYYRIKEKVTTYTAPDVMDYIRTKAELSSLRRDLKIWTRRKALKDMALSTALVEMRKLLGAKVPDLSWFQ